MHRATSNGRLPGDDSWMRHALSLAEAAGRLGEIPVGAAIVRDGRLIAEAHNLRETLSDPTAHAERLALSLAGRTLETWRLSECSLYVTLEPCVMCAGAIVLSRLSRIIYGASDPKAGACRSLYRITDDPRLNHRVEVVGGVLDEECSRLLSDFFKVRRKISDRHPPEGCLSG